MDKKLFKTKLLIWWKKNKRDFSWRNTNNAYELIIAEIMLRKTTSQQVSKLYDTFIEIYPSPFILKNAVNEDLVNLLKPLGMEKIKAETLIKFATVVVENFNGEIPLNTKELLSLPGIGKYSANALLSLICNESAPMVDTNFIRILERLFNYKSAKSRAREDIEVWEFAKTIIPENKSGDFNLAILDFAALICTARLPKCKECFFTDFCYYFITS